ncbi:hypothetical protein MPTK2_7g10120 [Marchantia polymorpha subsp. ruderalis]
MRPRPRPNPNPNSCLPLPRKCASFPHPAKTLFVRRYLQSPSPLWPQLGGECQLLTRLDRIRPRSLRAFIPCARFPWLCRSQFEEKWKELPLPQSPRDFPFELVRPVGPMLPGRKVQLNRLRGGNNKHIWGLGHPWLREFRPHDCTPFEDTERKSDRLPPSMASCTVDVRSCSCFHSSNARPREETRFDLRNLAPSAFIR